jgi:hypothetical protein
MLGGSGANRQLLNPENISRAGVVPSVAKATFVILRNRKKLHVEQALLVVDV